MMTEENALAGGLKTDVVWEDLVVHPEPTKSGSRRSKQMPWNETLATYWTHELRAPLTSINSALGLLQEKMGEQLNADTDHILRLALKNTDRLASLVNDIMDFSSAQAGRIPLTLEQAAPRDLIREATDALMSWSVSKGIKLLRVQEQEPLPRVFADKRRSVQILINLISNAIKFTPSGGRIEVYARMGKLDNRGAIVFSVWDTGPGIRSGDRERIFRHFEQAANGKSTAAGTGIGLALSKALVELQGGKIWVESWKGLGSTFRFTVPIAAEDLSRSFSPFRRPLEFHRLLMPLFRHLNAIAALFSV